MREFQSPNIEGLHFCPENITYDAIGRKYKERFVEDVVRKLLSKFIGFNYKE